ncbi:MAG: SDR family NAD(P)-dependent oxidoreductase [Candidatus Dormibacteria bacterium]
MQEWAGSRGKRVIITGATNGIGLAAAEALARRGALVTIVARNAEKGAAARSSVARASRGASEPDVLMADLSSQQSVRELAAEALHRYPRIDVLVNNAGAIYDHRLESVDGIELTWALNHLASFLLTNLLLERTLASAPARIVTTSSDAHKGLLIPFDDLNAQRSYGARGLKRYGATKLANILFTVELARRLRGTQVTANCFHPGLVATGWNRNNGAVMSLGMAVARPFSRSPRKGAETLVWLVDSSEAGAVSGGYFVDCRQATPSSPAADAEGALRLWRVSEEQIRQTSSQ